MFIRAGGASDLQSTSGGINLETPEDDTSGYTGYIALRTGEVVNGVTGGVQLETGSTAGGGTGKVIVCMCRYWFIWRRFRGL